MAFEMPGLDRQLYQQMAEDTAYQEYKDRLLQEFLEWQAENEAP